MADSSARALMKRSAESALMPPPPPPKRQKRPTIVLDEDEYSQAVSDIIARDFFPSLQEVQAQSEYLEAVDSKDKAWIREAGRNLTQVMTPTPDDRRRGGRGTRFESRLRTPGITPRSNFGGTPGATPGKTVVEERKPAVNTDMSLAAFQAKYTSEDNESFNALLDKQNAQKASTYAFLHHGNKIPTARQIAHRAREAKLLEQGKITSTALVASDSRNTMSAAVPRPSQDLDLRPASLDSFPNRQGARNHFMFGPDGVEDQRSSQRQSPGEAARGSPRKVKYANTRFDITASGRPDHDVPASPSLSAIDAAIAGRPRPTDSEPGYTGAETPRVNGYAFVDAEPTPSELGLPIDEAEAEAAEHEAAMQLLPKVDNTGPNLFKIAESSNRENIHRRLVEKADAERRKGDTTWKTNQLGITPGRTSTPSFASSLNIRKSTGMTPAAKRLADKISTPRREGGIFGNRTDWTPNQRARRPA